MDQQQKDYFYGRKWTLKGQMFYPALFQPNQKDDGRLQYSLMFAWAINDPQQAAVVQEIQQFLHQAKQMFFANFPDQFFVMPIKQWGVYQKQDGTAVQDFLEGKYWLNANSSGGRVEAPDTRFKPIVVDQNQQEIIDPAMIYSGANCLLNLSFYSYDGRAKQGKTGIGANIGAVMVLPGGEKVVTGGVNLDEAFGGFKSDMAQAGGAFPGAPAAPVVPQQVPGQAMPAYTAPAAPAAPVAPAQVPPMAPNMPANPAGNVPVPPVAPQAPVAPQVPTTPPNVGGGYAAPASPSNPAVPPVPQNMFPQ